MDDIGTLNLERSFQGSGMSKRKQVSFFLPLARHNWFQTLCRYISDKVFPFRIRIEGKYSFLKALFLPGWC